MRALLHARLVSLSASTSASASGASARGEDVSLGASRCNGDLNRGPVQAVSPRTTVAGRREPVCVDGLQRVFGSALPVDARRGVFLCALRWEGREAEARRREEEERGVVERTRDRRRDEQFRGKRPRRRDNYTSALKVASSLAHYRARAASLVLRCATCACISSLSRERCTGKLWSGSARFSIGKRISAR